MSPTAMSPMTADYAALAREGYEQFNNDDFDGIPELLTDDVELVNNAFGTTAHGKAAFVQTLQFLKAPFPDARLEVISQVVGEDFVVNECIFRGTNTAPLMNPDGTSLPATGKRVEVPFCEVWRVRDGKLASLHYYGDNMSFYQQLGLIPGMGQ
jgi:steroid delta-isomerase-like uncharacterized protein